LDDNSLPQVTPQAEKAIYFDISGVFWEIMPKMSGSRHMPTLWTILAFLVLYPIVGTLLFALMEKLPIQEKSKIVCLMVGHPVLVGLLLWIAFSFIHAGMATTVLILLAGALLRNAFSDAKFFVSLTKGERGLSIDYLTPLLRPKTLIIPSTAVKTFTFSSGKRHQIPISRILAPTHSPSRENC
jgi:hypothetical protein